MKKEYKELLRPHFEGVSVPILTGKLPLVSFVMAHYNCEEYLPDALDSLMAQSYPNWELLLVDDCSPRDDVENIVKDYNDPRMHFVRLAENSGAGAARNIAFSMSRGEYIVSFDPDDILHPLFLQFLVSEALGPASPDIVMYDLQCFGANTAVWKTKIREEKDITTTQWIVGVSLVKRRLWEATGGYSSAEEIRFGSQDWELWISAFEKASPIIVSYVQLPLMLYRRHKNSISAQSDFHEYKIRNRILADHRGFFERYKTGNTFIAEGYAMSFYAHADVRQWGKAFTILKEGFGKVPALLLVKYCKEPVRKLAYLGFRRLGRRYVLNPAGSLFGLFRKK